MIYETMYDFLELLIGTTGMSDPFISCLANITLFLMCLSFGLVVLILPFGVVVTCLKFKSRRKK